MTQALLNNLNNLLNQESTFTAQPKVDTKTCTDFDKIYEKQAELSQNTKTEKQEASLNTSESVSKNDKVVNDLDNAKNIQSVNDMQKVQDAQYIQKDCVNTEENSEENIVHTIGDLKETLSTNINDFKNILIDVTKEIAEEAGVELGLIKDAKEIIEDLNTTISEETDLDKEKDIDIESEIVVENEDTITEGISAEEDSLKNVNLDTNLLNTQGIVVQQQETKIENQKIDDNNISIKTENSEDLKVTLNGQDIESFFEDFGLNNTSEELSIIKPTQVGEQEGLKVEDLIEEDVIKDLNIKSIESETSNSDDAEMADLMKKQSPEELGAKVMIQAEVDFNELTAENTKPINQTTVVKPNAEASASKILEQVTKQLENFNGTSKVNIVLNPESLGKVSLQIINTNEGLSAQFTVATQEARDLLMKGLDGLKESLISQGVSVDNVSVKLNESQESEYQSDWTEQENSKGGNKEQSKKQNQEDAKKFEQMMFGFDNEENGNV